VKTSLICAALAVFLCSSPHDAKAGPAPYEFRMIADLSGSFAEFYPPAINNRQVVAFTAVQRTGDVGVFTVDQGNRSTILHSGADRRGVTINDDGMVCFSREFTRDGLGGGLFASSHGRITTVISDGLMTNWSANNRGGIAFNRNTDFEVNALYLYNAGRLTEIPNSQGGDEPYLNAGNAAMFIYREFESSRLYLSREGQRPALLIDTKTTPLAGISHAVINDRGTIALSASEDAAENRRRVNGIFMIADGKFTRYADDTGRYAALGSSLAINNSDHLAFTAVLDNGVAGIFTGPDPVRDKVVAVGDPLFGSTVTNLGFSRDGFNDHGVLAFRAKLADGCQVLVLAYPTAERTSEPPALRPD
jgi:hypothetical protein